MIAPKPRYAPVLTLEARRWLDGEMSSDDYFAWARRDAARRLGIRYDLRSDVAYVPCPTCHGSGFMRVEP